MSLYPSFFVAWTDDDGKEKNLLLDKSGKEFGSYDRAHWFENAQVLAVRGPDQRYALMDKNGDLITEFLYDDVSKAKGPFVWGELGKGEVLLDSHGHEYRIIE
ncbi:MAG: hypothetical protein LBJ61_11745 [Deltaproteobacteria bacterium]|nr:hypothetical protein [Deltaproteobacteria bacterium]